MLEMTGKGSRSTQMFAGVDARWRIARRSREDIPKLLAVLAQHSVKVEG